MDIEPVLRDRSIEFLERLVDSAGSSGTILVNEDLHPGLMADIRRLGSHAIDEAVERARDNGVRNHPAREEPYESDVVPLVRVDCKDVQELIEFGRHVPSLADQASIRTGGPSA